MLVGGDAAASGDVQIVYVRLTVLALVAAFNHLLRALHQMYLDRIQEGECLTFGGGGDVLNMKTCNPYITA